MLNYANLNDAEFEALCKDIMERMLGVSLRRFGPGRDHGVDLTDDAAKKKIVVQVKHYQNSTTDQLVRSLKNELPKVTALAPEKYYICCSRKLSVENVKVLYEYFSSYMDSDRHIITLIEIDDFLHQEVNRDILKRHHQLWLDDAGLLEELYTSISIPSSVSQTTSSDNSETSIDRFLSTLPALTLNPQCAPFAYDYSKLTNIWGRSEQIKLLDSFVEASTQRFLFSVVSGPAGIGKSKLVFCFGRSYQEHDGWIVRRVEPDHLSTLCKQDNWDSSNNILLIIDYANELKALSDLLSKLCTESASPHPNKIRVILISREGTTPSIYNRDQIIFPQWYKKIAATNSSINNHLFGNNFINLNGLSPEDCTELYRYYSLNHLGIHSSENQEKQVAKLIEQTVMDEDNSIRPLYALFVMDLYASNPNIKHWNLQYIQEQIYERDRKRWKKELLNQDCDHRRLFPALVNLLLYATIFGKWESDFPLPPPLSQDCDYIFDTVSTSESDDRSKWFKMMTGQEEYKDGTPVLSRLTPDMIGEFFALKTLSQFNRTTLVLWERLMASNLSKCSKFFIRTIEDYGNNEFFIGVLLKLFEGIVALIDDNDHVAHQNLCLILEHFYSNYRGNESDAFLLRTRELLNHYIDDHKQANTIIYVLDRNILPSFYS